MAFTNLTRRDEHCRWRHWFTATSYDLLLSLCQRHHLPPSPSDDNEDREDNDEDNKDKDNSEDDSNSENNDEDNEDNSDNDDDNEDDHNDEDDTNTKDNEEDDNEEDDDKEDNDDDEEDDEDDNGLGLDEDLWCLCTQFDFVRRLIVVLGPDFRVSYTTSVVPDHRVITTLQDCLGLPVIICGFCLVDIPSDAILTILHHDCLLEDFCLAL
jgi:DNA mismatch repair ATPase MutL